MLWDQVQWVRDNGLKTPNNSRKDDETLVPETRRFAVFRDKKHASVLPRSRENCEIERIEWVT